MLGMTILPGTSFRLFVYGTLMRDGRLHGVLADQVYLGAAVTLPLYGLLDLGAYPGLIRPQPDGAAIEGELYQVRGERRELLDEMEDAPALFRLERVELEGEPGLVYAYFYQGDPACVPRYAARRWEQRAPSKGTRGA